MNRCETCFLEPILVTCGDTSRYGDSVAKSMAKCVLAQKVRFEGPARHGIKI